MSDFDLQSYNQVMSKLFETVFPNMGIVFKATEHMTVVIEHDLRTAHNMEISELNTRLYNLMRALGYSSTEHLLRLPDAGVVLRVLCNAANEVPIDLESGLTREIPEAVEHVQRLLKYVYMLIGSALKDDEELSYMFFKKEHIVALSLREDSEITDMVRRFTAALRAVGFTQSGYHVVPRHDLDGSSDGIQHFHFKITSEEGLFETVPVLD